MASIRFSKTVYSKEGLEKSVDRSFKTFVELNDQDNDSIEEFFRLYDKFFYDITPQGEFNSHEFLIRESSKVVELEKDNLDVQPLLDEIADLRERLLQQNINNLDEQNEIFKSINSENSAVKENEKLLDSLRANIESVSEQRTEAPAPVPSAQTKIVSVPETKVKKRKRGTSEVLQEAARLKRKGLTRGEILEKLKEFGANAFQIARAI